MSGPKNAQEALSWIKEAVREGRYQRTKHLFDRAKERLGKESSEALIDLLAVIQRASEAEPYTEPPRQGGTCWRVHVSNLDGRKLAVGVEAFLDNEQRWTILITVMDDSRKGGRR